MGLKIVDWLGIGEIESSKTMAKKHEWRKDEKSIYLPKTQPELIDVPEFGFFVVEGEGNPNSEAFIGYVEVLYGLSYLVKMSSKKKREPKGFYEYAVYPLEGVWDITDKAKREYDGTLNKDELVFKLMIRQPDFVTADYARQAIQWAAAEKPHPLIDKVRFEKIKEGRCIQMLHKGSFDSEPATFEIMEDFAREQGVVRKSKIHREIYLSDARRNSTGKIEDRVKVQTEMTN